MRKKIRRESGRTYNKIYDPELGFYNEVYWDDWNDYRDGFRAVFSDYSLIAPSHISSERWCNQGIHYNSKLKMLLNRRKLRKINK